MESPKRALIIGINGQMGSYLKELLLEKGYRVHGLIRQFSMNMRCPYENLKQNCDDIEYHYGDLADSCALIRVMSSVRPHEVYNVGSVSNAQISFDLSEYVQQVDGMGTLRLLEALRSCNLAHFTRIYQAGSAELFGLVNVSPQDEDTPFHPRSPYGVSKQYSYWIMINYREAYGMHASNGILYNSESPRRSKDFVTRKITSSVARIKKGYQTCLEIGNLDAKRDWSHVKDFARGMWLMLQHDKGDDYVLSSGISRSVREFVTEAFAAVGITILWIGDRGSISEQGVDSDNTDRVLVRVNPAFFRPPELYELRGNSTKARTQLSWQPTVSFRELIREMVDVDLQILEKECKMSSTVNAPH